MVRSYYHATPFENLNSILEKGIQRGSDGIVYLTEGKDEALRFVAIRGCRNILTVEVELEEDLVEEMFDHSQAFFRCKAFGYHEDIKLEDMKNFFQYKI